MSLKLVVPLVAVLALLYIIFKLNSSFSAGGLLNLVKDGSPTRRLKSTSIPADFYFELREQPKGLIAESLTTSKKRAQTQKSDSSSSKASRTSELLPKTTVTTPPKEMVRDEVEAKPAPSLNNAALSHIALKSPKESNQTSEAKDEKSEQELVAQFAAKKRVISRYMYEASSESGSKKKETP